MEMWLKGQGSEKDQKEKPLRNNPLNIATIMVFLLEQNQFFHLLSPNSLFGLVGLKSNPILGPTQIRSLQILFFFFNSKFFYFYFNPNPNVCLSNIAICPYFNSHLLSSMAPSIHYYFNFNFFPCFSLSLPWFHLFPPVLSYHISFYFIF